MELLINEFITDKNGELMRQQTEKKKLQFFFHTSDSYRWLLTSYSILIRMKFILAVRSHT